VVEYIEFTVLESAIATRYGERFAGCHGSVKISCGSINPRPRSVESSCMASIITMESSEALLGHAFADRVATCQQVLDQQWTTERMVQFARRLAAVTRHDES
jgi:hypothetical protein